MTGIHSRSDAAADSCAAHPEPAAGNHDRLARARRARNRDSPRGELAQDVLACGRKRGCLCRQALHDTAAAGWNDALTLEEFAEPTCFTTAAFADSVHTMLAGH